MVSMELLDSRSVCFHIAVWKRNKCDFSPCALEPGIYQACCLAAELWCAGRESEPGGSWWFVCHSVEGGGRCWQSLGGGISVLRSRAPLHLLLLHQASVVWHDFALRKVESHLQGDEDSELKRYQLPPADPETLLELLHRHTTQSVLFSVSLIDRYNNWC